MKFFKKKIKEEKCALCPNKILTEEPYSVNINAKDGEVEIKICQECSRLLDAITDKVEQINNESV